MNLRPILNSSDEHKTHVCSYLEESCGYGEPLDPTTCSFCDGRCLRPTIKAVKKPMEYLCDIYNYCPHMSDDESASSGYFCRDRCGLGVDEDEVAEIDFEEIDIDDEEDPDDMEFDESDWNEMEDIYPFL